MSIHPHGVRALPIALCVAVMAASACGPIQIDVAAIPSPKPSGQPGSTPPSAAATTSPNPARSPVPSRTPHGPGPHGTPDPNATVAPHATADPNATPGPNGTLAPNGPTPSPGATAYPYPTTTPGAGGTPKPWPSAAALPGGTPVQGEVYEVKRDAGKPTDVAVDADGVAWITLGQFNVSGDPPKGELVQMGADGSPLKVLTLDGNPRRVEAASGGGVWVLMDVKSSNGGMTSTSVLRLSAEATVLSRLDLGYGGGGSSSGNEGLRLVEDGGGNVWVKNGTSWSSNQIYRIAPGGGLLGTYNAGSSGYSYGGLGVDKENHGWITDSSNKVAIRIASNMTKAAEHSTDNDGFGAYEIACSGDRVWLALQKEIAVWKLDGTREFGVPTGYPVIQMRAAGDGGMWALTSTGGYDSHSGSVVRFDKAGTATASYAVGPDVRGYGIGGDGAIWAANYTASTVTRVGTR